VTNVWIADETGKILLSLWNEQSNLINVGDTIQIKNATVAAYKGERQLRIGKASTLNILPTRTPKRKQLHQDTSKNTIYTDTGQWKPIHV